MSPERQRELTRPYWTTLDRESRVRALHFFAGVALVVAIVIVAYLCGAPDGCAPLQ